VVTIRCRENGPLVVEMPLGPDGKPQPLRVTDHHGHELTIPGQKRSVAPLPLRAIRHAAVVRWLP